MSEPQPSEKQSSARPSVVRFAVLMSAFFISYAVFQIPGAWVGQRFGARPALPAFAVAWSLATVAMAAGGFFMIIVSRVAKGLSQAGLFPVCTGVIAKWFPDTGRAFATGALASFMSVGGAAGAALTGWLVVAIGWRWMFALYSLPGLLWAAWFWKWFRNAPQEHGSVNAAERELIEHQRPAARAVEYPSPAMAGPNRDPRSPAPPTPWLQLLTSPAMWCICGQQFFRAAGYMFFTSWFATYLQESRGVSAHDAAAALGGRRQSRWWRGFRRRAAAHPQHTAGPPSRCWLFAWALCGTHLVGVLFRGHTGGSAYH